MVRDSLQTLFELTWYSECQGCVLLHNSQIVKKKSVFYLIILLIRFSECIKMYVYVFITHTFRRRCRMRNTLLRNNRRSARSRWGNEIDARLLQTLKVYTERFKLSICNGDLVLLDRSWYVTHTGLVGLANRKHCQGIDVQPSVEFSHPSSSRWAFKATVFKSRTCKGFAGYGDADPSNVSALVHGAEMRVAETRAVNQVRQNPCVPDEWN